MSYTLGVQPWFQRVTVGADLARHAREFGITFVDDDCSGGNNNNIKSVPDLIPIGERRKRRRSSDAACGRVSGSVVMIDGDNHEEAKLLRLFGGGDSDSGVSVNSVAAAEGEPASAESRCSVVLDPLPSDLLRSLSVEGRISAEKAAKTCQSHEWEDSLPMISDNEVQGLLQNLVEEGEDSEPTLARCQRQESLLQPPSPRDDAIDDDVRDEASRDATVAPPTVVKAVRQRKSEAPRKAIRRRRERHSTSSGRKKRRKRSTSCSTTSSARSASPQHLRQHRHHHHHNHKHRHRRRSPTPPPPRARVNPIFVWAKQVDTRIIEVLCEDYDKRNRIRLTKTAHGWRAIPRTERLSSMPAQTVPEDSAAGSTKSVHQMALETDELAGPPTENATGRHNITSLVPEDDELHDGDDDATFSQHTKDEFEDGTLLELESSGIDNIIDNVLSPTPEDCEAPHELNHEGSESENEEEGGDIRDKEGADCSDSVDSSANCDCAEGMDTANCDCAEVGESMDDAGNCDCGEAGESMDEVGNCDCGEAGESMDDAGNCDCAGVADDAVNCECADDDGEPCDETCLKSPVDRLATDTDEKVASALEEDDEEDEEMMDAPAVEEPNDEQVVPKDNVVLAGSDAGLGSVAATSAPAEEDLKPTDLSLPKTNDEHRHPPRPVFARSLSSILRTPRALTLTPTSSSSPLPSPISRASPRLGISPALPEPAVTADVIPAHQVKQQQKSMFLESLLSSPRKCHQLTKPTLTEGTGALDLGKSSVRSSGSPTVTCSEEVTKRESDEPKPKCLKLEDITLKSLLNRQTESKNSIKEEKFDVQRAKSQEALKTSESTKARKSRLLELLTSEPAQNTVLTDLDPLTQLKKILSDPELAIPDPLLVPRDRLHELVSSPAKEIPRLLTLRPELRLPEALAYPSLLQDPNLLVVSIAYLQNLLRNPDKPLKESDSYSSLGAFLEWQRFQSQQMQAVEILEAQLKQQSAFAGRDMDPTSAQALNQMMWLPYLSQLEATAMACGNNQEFLNALNAVFPTNYGNGCGGVPYPPNMGVPPSFQMSDYKAQLELQQTFSIWQEVMAQAAASAQPFKSTKNGVNTKPPPSTGNKMVPNRPPNVAKKNFSSARTSPITPNFHGHSRGAAAAAPAPPPHHPYSPMVPGTHHQYSQPQSRGRPSNPGPPRPEPPSRPAVTCKSLRNLLSSPRREESPSEILAPFSKAGLALGHEQPPPKLKVKQHLVDPTIKPKLLKHEIKPEERVSPPQLHPHLWHPLFGSQKSSYNSPWQWTTVTVNGE